MKEHDIQKQLVQYLRLKGWVTICSDMTIGSIFLGRNQKQRMAFFNYCKGQGLTKGQPDLIAIKGNQIFFIEVKTEKGKLSIEQAKMERLLPNYHIIRSLDELIALIN